MATMNATLEEFLATLDAYRRPISLDELRHHLEGLQVSLEDIRPYALFGKQTYQRNLMHAGPTYQALVLCWRAGQRSPIHDHQGSSCGVRVIAGTATETIFERTTDGHVYATKSVERPTGGVCGSVDSDIHQVSNLQTNGTDLITLHVYSPPLLRMGMYSLTNTRVEDFLDPVVGFENGAGI